MITNAHQDIKTMKLYTHVERVQRELASQGLADGPLSPDDLVHLDQLHYGGHDAVDVAIDRLGLDEASHVLDVGAGLGGPARHLAAQTGCSVSAIELQPDLNRLATTLTDRCDLTDQVHHHCEDFLAMPLSPAHDALVSWLTFLHIPNRSALFNQCHRALKPEGCIFIEDFYARVPLDDQTQATLAKEVYCDHLPSWSDYQDDLETAGFEAIELEDMSQPWTTFVTERFEAFETNAEAFIECHGEPTYTALSHFYGVMADLFNERGLGGVRIQASAGPLGGTA